MNNLSIWKRLTSETPKFWIRAQILCLAISAILGHVLSHTHVISPVLGGILIGLFSGGAAFAQLAVKDGDLIKEVATDPLIIIDKFGELQNDFATLKAAFANHNPATLDDIKKAIADSTQQSAAIPAQITVQAPVAEAAPAAAPTADTTQL